MKINRVFIKGTNWALAGLISLLGFSNCENEPLVEYGPLNADFTIKGTVVNKANGKPIEGIRVGYNPEPAVVSLYGVISTPYTPKVSVSTDANGEFKLTDKFIDFNPNLTIPVYVDDIDGEQNGLFQSDTLQVDFSKTNSITVKVELTEIVNQ